MIPVILSGGAGTRLWPLSRGMYPKQLLALAGAETTMLQETLRRGAQVSGGATPIVVCNNEHRFMVAEQMAQIDLHGSILLEPAGRNTAPAIAAAALHALSIDEDPLLLVMPADHIVTEPDSFSESIAKGVVLASKGRLVTFGISPTHPETGYGYIRAGAALDGGFEVQSFHEKPGHDTAEAYISQGGYFWNGGIFLFKASRYLAELERYHAALVGSVQQAVDAAIPDLDFIRLESESFARADSISIDYAVMEKTEHAAVVPLECGWSDVGSWSALWDVLDKDERENASVGDVILQNTERSLIFSESKLVAASGVKDLVIVQTEDAVLVTDLSSSQDIKSLVAKLTDSGRSQVSHHRKVYRPWGWYDSVDEGARFQVKRIMVKPGAKLSLQKHKHRAEHWVVVSGCAEVVNGEETLTLNENQSTYIAQGVVHSLRNPSKNEPLEIIEVQSGSYLGEDDIVRLEDDYGRI